LKLRWAASGVVVADQAGRAGRLGPLEAEVMAVLWRAGRPMPVREVAEAYTGPQAGMRVQPGLELRSVAECEHHSPADLVAGRLHRHA
jgi:hypothetical protein